VIKVYDNNNSLEKPGTAEKNHRYITTACAGKDGQRFTSVFGMTVLL
jgi:hypothetical protein